MPNWVALSRQRHQKAGWQKCTNHSFAAQDHVVPVLVQELSKFLMGNVLVFVPAGEQFLLVSLQSLTPNENWYVGPKGKWMGGYLPAAYRGHPFRLLSANGVASQNKMLCADADSGLWNDECQLDQRPVFDESGELSEELNKTLEFLKQCEDNRVATQERVDQLNDAGLIIPWNIKWQAKQDDEVKQIAGLYRIDEVKLKSLAPETLKALTESGALALVYAQLFSMHSLHVLKMFGQARLNVEEKMQEKTEQGAENVDLDQLFGGDEDVFKF